MKRLITITATVEHEVLDDDELPEDCDSPEEAFDAIKESLEDQSFTLDVGDQGEIELTVTDVKLSDVPKK